MESPDGEQWGWYEHEQLPSLITWLENGNAAEQELAEDLYEHHQQVGWPNFIPDSV